VDLRSLRHPHRCASVPESHRVPLAPAARTLQPACSSVTRATRLTTLETARSLGRPLEIDEAVGVQLARLRVALEAIGRAMKVMDAWIAATAIAQGAAVCTQDGDFEAAHEAGMLQVIRV
jgi:predicted nucleic acid-binding protein